MKNFKALLIPFKRIFYFINRSLKIFFQGTIWLISSKEHTNFSFNLNNYQIQSIGFIISEFFNINYHKVLEEIKVAQSYEIKKINYSIFRTIDLDFVAKWDYRLIPYLLVKFKNVENIFEFGVDQGRLGFLLSKLNEIEPGKYNFQYFGIENNKRKAVLLDSLKLDKFNIIFNNSEKELTNFSNSQLNNSLIISSTHNLPSEKYLFDYLSNQKIYPQYIISDRVSQNSSYKKFVLQNDYIETVVIFNDKNEFLTTNYIGIAKRNF